jgi:hypothetical protein
MIAEFSFGTQLLRPAIRETPVNEVVIEQLDAADGVPLRTVCWLTAECPGRFERTLREDRTVDDATRVLSTDYGYQFRVTHSPAYPGTSVYDAAVTHDGVFITGSAGAGRWEMRMRFPDRDAFSTFRTACDRSDIGLSVQTVEESEAGLPNRAGRYGLSEPQREILLLAAEEGYFEVPREASLADLADDLDVSSQAASERLRRGLDSVVGQAIVPTE